MDALIESVDYEPQDLAAQTPFSARLLRKIPGSDRPDYWLAELHKPISWTNNGEKRIVRHVVLAPRWVGTSIQPNAKLPVAIAYVINDAALEASTLDFGHTEYVAIGMATISH